VGDPHLYSVDRYPAFPWAVSLLADGRAELAAVGLHLSMAATAVTAVAAYALARQLGGRTAAFVATCLVLRLPGLVDAGRQFTPYAGLAAADLTGVAGLVALARGRTGAAAPVALAAAAVFAADPKQVPVALAFVAVGVVFALGTRRLAGLAAAALLLAALPLVNAALAHGPAVGSIEFITARVPLGFTVDPAMPLTGWSPGDPFAELWPTLARVQAAVSVPAARGWFDPSALEGLRMQLPDTSPGWLAFAAALPLLAAARTRRVWPLLLPLALAPLAPVALSALHLHFQHRYALALVVLLPPLVAAGVARALGPAGLAAVACVTLLVPGSRWRAEAPGLLYGAPPRGAEPWAGREAHDWVELQAAAEAALPADAVVLDYAAARPWEMLGGVREYHRCTWLPDTCRSLWTTPGTLYAVLYPGEAPSRQDAPGAATLAAAAAPPAEVGLCWTRVLRRPGVGGLYQWTCARRPTPP
jgi:hypothetical protein